MRLGNLFLEYSGGRKWRDKSHFSDEKLPHFGGMKMRETYHVDESDLVVDGLGH
jgi:hypothetical protein